MSSLFYKVKGKPFLTLKLFFRGVKWSWQRARKGYCTSDLFGVSNWFLEIVPNMLDEIREKSNAFPSVLMDEAWESVGIKNFEETFAASEEDRRKATAYGQKKWEEILSRTAFLFREANSETCTRKNSCENEYLEMKKELQSRGKNLLECPECEDIVNRYMEEQRAIYTYQEECRKEAFELFYEWFYNFAC